jgi:alpha-1,2-mannosyltransferase
MAFLLRNGPSPSIAKNPSWVVSALAFPAVFLNLTHGHNGFLTAALMATALATLDREPIVAGIFFGLLAYKPQFGLLIPLVLVSTARWRTFISAAITVGALTTIATAIFGENIWPAFLASMHFTRVVVLEQGGTGFFKIQSVFACVRMWGGSVMLAYVAQGATTLAAAILLVRLWRSDAPFAHKGAALCLAALLATPYSLDYDLMVLAPAIALLGSEGLARGFRPYEVTALVALWTVPLIARSIAHVTFIPLGVFAMLWVFVMTIARLAPESSAAIVRPLERQSV